MHIPSLVTYTRLASLLNVYPDTLRRWRQSGFLPATTWINDAAHYSLESIDELLQRDARNFAVPPTAVALLAGELRLLTNPQIQEFLSLSKGQVASKVENGQLAALKLNDWRYCYASAYRYKARLAAENVVPRSFVEHTLGVTESTVGDWVNAGLLETVETAAKQNARPVSIQSLVALLRQTLPNWIEPRQWLQASQDDPRPLLMMHQLVKHIGLDSNGEGASALMENHQLFYLQIMGGGLRFTPGSADMVLMREGKVPIQGIANVFGVTTDIVRQWIASNILVCKIHTHFTPEFYRACLVDLLRLYLTSGSRPLLWYKSTIGRSDILVDFPTACQQMGISPERFIAFVRSGDISGLCLPGTQDEWRFHTTHLKNKRRKLLGA
jgi:hypothetical protein